MGHGLVLGVLVFFRGIAALVLAASLLVGVTQAASVLNGGPKIDFRTNVLGLSLDILLIIALSSEHSRIYAKRISQGRVPRSRVAAV